MSVGAVDLLSRAASSANIAVPSLDSSKSAGPNFGDALTNALADAGASERQSADASQKFAAGDPSVGIHEVIIGAEKATIAVKYAVTLKNKVLEAYREIMNTPL